MRFFVAMVSHETNTFSPLPTGRAQFEAHAVLDVNDVKLILVSQRRQALDPEMIRFVGIDPLAEKILVVKSSIHYRAAFEPIARAILEVDAPGLSSSNLERFPFARVRRPIFPLDDL